MHPINPQHLGYQLLSFLQNESDIAWLQSFHTSSHVCGSCHGFELGTCGTWQARRKHQNLNESFRVFFKKQRFWNRIFGKNWKMDWKMVSRKKSTHWTLGYDGSLHPLICKAYSYPKFGTSCMAQIALKQVFRFRTRITSFQLCFPTKKPITSYPRNFSHLHHLAVAVPNDRDQNEHQCYLKEIERGKKRKAMPTAEHPELRYPWFTNTFCAFTDLLQSSSSKSMQFGCVSLGLLYT